MSHTRFDRRLDGRSTGYGPVRDSELPEDDDGTPSRLPQVKPLGEPGVNPLLDALRAHNDTLEYLATLNDEQLDAINDHYENREAA